MTNYEKYKDELIKKVIIETHIAMDIHTGKVVNCGNMDCRYCGFSTGKGCCIEDWLDSEYVEPEKEEVDWSKVPIDTKILVSTDEINWYRRYFAGIDTCTNECLAWLDGATSWANRSTRPWKHVKLYKEDEENE